MHIKTAESIVYANTNMTNKWIDRVSESNTYFLFSFATKDENSVTRRPMIPPLGVHKVTGKVSYVNPATLSSEELSSIRPIR